MLQLIHRSTEGEQVARVTQPVCRDTILAASCVRSVDFMMRGNKTVQPREYIWFSLPYKTLLP